MNPRTKFFRGLAMLGVLGIGLSACKEELVLPDPVPTISITPSGTIELRPGESAQVTATVTGLSDNSVSYSSSNASVATVNAQTGLVQAVAEGTATITARANAQQTLQASVQIRVQGEVLPPTPEPAVTLESVTQTATNLPVNPQNVFGQVDVTAEVQRGPADELRFFVVPQGGQPIEIEGCRQVFGSATAAATITAPDLRLAPNQTDVVCSINTMAFTVAGGVGDPTFDNGPQQFRIELLESGAVIATATSGVHVFNNEDFIQVDLIPQRTAIAPATGLLWSGGEVTVRAIPVIYTGEAIAQVTIIAESGATRSDDTLPFEVTFPLTGSNNIGGITDDDFFFLVNSVRTNGQPGPSEDSDDYLPAGVTAFRLDTEAPDPGVFELTDQNTNPVANTPVVLCCSNNWVGAAYNFNNGHTGENDADSGLPGVGIKDITFHAGPASMTASQIAATPALPTETGADLEETALNNELEVVVRVVDHLENVVILAMSGSLLNPGTAIGVDKTSPTAEFAPASEVDQAIFNIVSGPPGSNFVVAFADAATGGAAPSGFGTDPVLARVRRIFPNLTSGQQCLIPGSFGTTTGCRLSGSTGTTPVPNADNGYFIYEATAVDQAGNLSHPLAAPISRIVLNDQTAPSSSNVAIPATLTGGAQTTFTAQATDDLNLWRGDFRFEYGGVILPFTNRQVFNTRFVDNIAGLVTAANASVTLPFVRALEQVDGANNPDGNPVEATAVRLFVEDAAANNFLQTNAFAPGTVPDGVSFDTRGVLTFQVETPSGATDVWNGLGTQPTTPPTPTSVTVTATATGASGTFANPFAVVHFYRVDPVTGNELFVSANNPSVTDDGVTRTWTWTATFDATGLDDQANVPIFAVGVHSAGDALQAANNTNISIIPGL